MTSVERIELAPGFSVARVLTGLWQVADMERGGDSLDAERAADAMQPYVERGFTTFDMADHYGSAEVIAGALRAKLARPPELLTKWVPEPGRVTRDDVRAAVERALARLDVECIDLLQLHTWNYADLSYLDCLEHLEELRGEGLIRHLGLTNFDTAHLRVVCASGFQVLTNQVSHSLIDRRAAGALAAYCAESGVRLLCYGTLAGGLLSERWLGRPEPAADATWSQAKYKRFIDAAGGWSVFQGVLGRLADIARGIGTDVAALAARSILDEPCVAGIIVGARLGESEHIEANAALSSLKLTDTTRAAVAEACAPFAPIPGDCGDEYRRQPFLTASGDLSHHLEGFPPRYAAQTLGGGRARVDSGTPWEELAGYARAVRDGRRILVSGTTATSGEGRVGGDDPAAQTHFVIDKIAASLEALGGRLEDVVRTRVYVNAMEDWEAVSRAHGERFREIRPANTLLQARLVGEGYRVEIEAEALLPAQRGGADDEEE